MDINAGLLNEGLDMDSLAARVFNDMSLGLPTLVATSKTEERSGVKKVKRKRQKRKEERKEERKEVCRMMRILGGQGE